MHSDGYYTVKLIDPLLENGLSFPTEFGLTGELFVLNGTQAFPIVTIL